MIFTLAVPTVEAVMERHHALISEVIGLMMVPENLKNVLQSHPLSPLRNAARMYGPLPASEFDHDSDDYGLFRHSLGVVRIALRRWREVRQINESSTPSRELIAEQVSILSAGLAHDLGKVLFMVVAPPQPTNVTSQTANETTKSGPRPVDWDIITQPFRRM